MTSAYPKKKQIEAFDRVFHFIVGDEEIIAVLNCGDSFIRYSEPAQLQFLK